MFLIMVEPAYMEQFPAINRFYIYGSFLAVIILFFLVVLERLFNLTILWIGLFYGVGLIATVFGSGEVYAYCKSEFCALSMCLMAAVWMRRSPETLIKSAQILQVFVYINLATVILYPDGLYTTDLYWNNWFLGYKNPQIRTILPIVALSLIYSYWKHGRLSLQSYALLACSCATFLLVGSSTALVGMGLFLLLVFLFHSKVKRIPRFINLGTAFVAVFVLQLGIIFFSVQNHFAWFIEGVLQKSLDFTSRVGIWETALGMVADKPILGYGYLNSEYYTTVFGFVNATHPHNLILYILCTGGFVLLLVVVLGIIYATVKLDASMESVYSKILFSLLVCFFVMGITEALTATVMLYPSLIMAMEADKFAAMGYRKGADRPPDEAQQEKPTAAGAKAGGFPWAARRRGTRAA